MLGLARPGEPAAERLHAVDRARRSRPCASAASSISASWCGSSSRGCRCSCPRTSASSPTTSRSSRCRGPRPARSGGTKSSAARSNAPRARPRRGRSATTTAPGCRSRRTPRRCRSSASALGRPVVPHANLELDLGLDSMERVELLTVLERRQGTQVAAEVRATIFTVRQLVDAVLAAPASAESGHGGRGRPRVGHAAGRAAGSGTRREPVDDPSL